jgi:hypothetical protein
MPTPTRFFHEIAARYGEVDPSDTEAVQDWYVEVLPTLPVETIDEILEWLLHELGGPRLDEPGTDGSEPQSSYPPDAALPSLSASLPAPVPQWAVGRREPLLSLLRRILRIPER